MARKLLRHQQLVVYRKAFEVAMQIFEISKGFPEEETYSLTDQVRRSSRSVTSNIAETWRKRRYTGAFISKLNNAEGECGETQTWLEYAVRCDYMEREQAKNLFLEDDEVVAMLFSMQTHPGKWIIEPKAKARTATA